jgi:outer membrane biosynthesis protein TonB
MSMDRAEQAGLGVALAGHVALFGLLSAGLLATSPPPIVKPQAMEVVLTDEIGLDSAAPDPSMVDPAARLAEEEGPVEPALMEAAPAPEPTPVPKPVPAPVPKPKPVPLAKPEPAKAQPKKAAPPKAVARPVAKTGQSRPTGSLSGLVDGLTDRPSRSNSTSNKASQSAAQARKSIDVAIDGEIRSHWQRAAPTGADVEKLKTVLEIRLNQNGSLAGEPRLVSQTGKTDSNAPQQQLHVERAIKAIKLAAPFKLPVEYYDQWKTWRIEFDARLAR